MNPSFKELRKLAKEKEIKYYCFKSKEELCKELGLDYIPYTPGKHNPIKTLIRRVSDGETIYFQSLSALARSVGKNTVSVSYYEKTKKPMTVVEPGLRVTPGQYIVEKWK